MLHSKTKVKIYIYYQNNFRINPITKKLIFLSQKDNLASNCKLKIFDIEENHLFIRTMPLKFIKSLKGMSQISTSDSLYLCGSNNKNSSCFLIYFFLKNADVKSNILVNSVYPHYNPILFLVKDDILLVIGGKLQVLCEKYSIKLKQWRDMAILPEERYHGNVILNEQNSHLYLFGGLTNGIYNDSILLLNLRSVGSWEKIFIKENGHLLKRCKFINFSFEYKGNKNKKDNYIYIFGGIMKEREKYDFIVEYDCQNNIINKKEIDLKELPYFDITTVINIDKNKNIFTDSKENIYIVEKNNFRISMINSEDT
jgi:hypothetical protein